MPASIAAIAAKLGPVSRRFDIDVLTQCESTNAVLLERAEAGAPSGTVVIAENQIAGRGRRGRNWFSSAGDSLTFSLLWRFAPGTAPAGLSLAIGVAVARALEHALRCRDENVTADATGSIEGGRAKHALSGKSTDGIALKWPNDIIKDGRKLGGILIELLPGAPHVAVIGIGINLNFPVGMPDDVRAASSVFNAPVGMDEDELHGGLLAELLATLETFAAEGFAAIRPEWMARHAMQDAAVSLLADFGPSTKGICRGVDNDGALLLDVGGRIERILSGEVSLRVA